MPDGEKMLGLRFLKADIDMVHAASYDCDARLDLMDRMGISHGIVYPNVGGFGNQNFLRVQDEALRIACVEIYNDWMTYLQQRSGGRILPMALVPWWDIDASVAEVDRMQKKRGQRNRHVLQPPRLRDAQFCSTRMASILGNLRSPKNANQLSYRSL